MSKEVASVLPSEIPKRWYESNWPAYATIFTTSMFFAVIDPSTFTSPLSTTPEFLTIRILSAAAYVIGSVGDRNATVKILQSMNNADEVGLNHGMNEFNATLPGNPTVEQYNNLLNAHGVSQIGGLVLSILFPSYGFGLSLGRGVAMLHNSRLRMRLDRNIQKYRDVVKVL